MTKLNCYLKEVKTLQSKFGGYYYRLIFQEAITENNYEMPVQSIFRNYKKIWKPIIQMREKSYGMLFEGLVVKEGNILSADHLDKIRSEARKK